MPRHPIARLTAVAAATVILSGYLIAGPENLAGYLAPTAVTVWIVFTIHHGYLAIRTFRWQRRRRGETGEQPADIPAPAGYPGVELIQTAQRATTPSIADYQGVMYARGIVVAAIPPLAVLIAAVQATTSPPESLAAGLSIANTALLVTLILLVWRARNPSQPWVQARTRTELLRREQFLCLAHVGPYQGLTPVDEMAEHRAQILATAADESLEQLIPMRTNQTPWSDRLWTEPNPPLEQLDERARAYLHYRVDNQIGWFTASARHNRTAERHTATVIKLSILAAVTATAIQTGLQLAHSAQPRSLNTTTGILTLVLPPVCAFMLAIQQLYAHRRLAASYGHTLRELVDARTRLTGLLPTLDSRQFQAIVVHTEHNLAGELQRWRMLTHRDEYELSL